MGWEGPYYFLEGGNRDARVSLPRNFVIRKEYKKYKNAAEYWSIKLGLNLRMPNNSIQWPSYWQVPEFKHMEYDIDPEVAHNKIVKMEKQATQSVDVACPHCDEHLSIEAPFEDEYVCPLCDLDFEFDSDHLPKSSGNFDWYSSHREPLLEAITNHTVSEDYQVLEEQKGTRGLSAIGRIFTALIGLPILLGFTLVPGIFLLMLPFALLQGASGVPIIIALIMSFIGFWLIIPMIKTVGDLIKDFINPKAHERYTRTQYFDPVSKYTAWIEFIRTSTKGRSSSLFVISEAILSDSHTLNEYYVPGASYTN